MMPKSKIPHIRFKGFTGVWNENEIGNLANITTGGTPNTSNVSYWNPKQIPWMSSGEINKKRLFSTDNQISELGLNNSSAKWIKNNSVLIALAGQGKTRGTVGINYIPLTTNQSIAAITSDDKLHYEFLYQNLESRYEELRMESSGDGTRGGLNKQIISNIFIFYPEKNEQIRIGNYFYQLDKLIEQKEKKYQKLKQFKKAMLDKMFPKNGADTPEIRFKGFSGKWKEKRLEEIALIKTGYPFDSNKFDANGEYLVITNGNIQNDFSFVDNLLGNKINIEDKCSLTEYILNLNDILVTMDGTVGRVAKVIHEKQILAQRVGRIIALIDSDFVYYFLSTGDFFKKMKLISTGGTIKHISLNDISKYESYIPKDFEEQEKIGNYFQKLDKQIDLQQKELEKLKNIKKASLSKMFV